MIRDLLTAEAHSDPYLWAAVLLAHAMIGVGAQVVLGRGWRGLAVIAVSYAAFEVVQGALSSWVLADSLLDWCAVMLGALTAALIREAGAWQPVAALAAVLVAGAWRRRR